MTIILPEDYHARQELERTRVLCVTPEDAARQDIRPLRIGILNVMPKAETYEFSLLQPLGRSIIQVEPLWVRLETHRYRSSNQAHIRALYVPFEEAVRRRPLDGLILTGAPVEEMPFEHVHYWDELAHILAYARRNVASTLGICWGGLALAKLVGIEKVMLPQKLFGVFQNRNLERDHGITGDTDDVFWCPQSRHSGVADDAVEDASSRGIVRRLAHSAVTGYTIFESADQRFLIHLGHPEYEPERLVHEYRRDVELGRSDVAPPANVDLEQPVNVWRSHRNEFFSQWLKFIYDMTSFTPARLVLGPQQGSGSADQESAD
ncbi:homoserine O-succinyltransferase [Myxococcota bacterium]